MPSSVGPNRCSAYAGFTTGAHIFSVCSKSLSIVALPSASMDCNASNVTAPEISGRVLTNGTKRISVSVQGPSPSGTGGTSPENTDHTLGVKLPVSVMTLARARASRMVNDTVTFSGIVNRRSPSKALTLICRRFAFAGNLIPAQAEGSILAFSAVSGARGSANSGKVFAISVELTPIRYSPSIPDSGVVTVRVNVVAPETPGSFAHST